MTQLTGATGPEAISVLTLAFEDHCLNSQGGVTEKVKKKHFNSTYNTFLCQYGNTMKLVKLTNINGHYS